MSGNSGKSSAELNIVFNNGALFASCRIEGATEWWSQPLALNVDLTALDAKLSQLTQVLTEAETSIWAALEKPLAAPAEDFVAEKFKLCVERVVSYGSELYKGLSALGLKDILDKINSTLTEGDRLTITTDCAFFPFEILYSFDYDIHFTAKEKAQNPPRPTELWGYKYMTDYILLPSPEERGGWQAPIEEHNSGAAYVSFNLNKEIEDDFQTRLFKPIQEQREFFASDVDPKGNWQDSADQIQEYLNSDNEATIIYLFCHGKSGSPLTGTENEVLQLTKDRSITPNALTLGSKYKRGPIVIMNSCTSAAVSPLSFSTFHRKFRQKRAMGIIGTTIKIPTTFAAAFGTELIRSYLKGVPIGKAIFEWRRRLLEINNPLGLFYSLQCPSYITAPGVLSGQDEN